MCNVLVAAMLLGPVACLRAHSRTDKTPAIEDDSYGVEDVSAELEALGLPAAFGTKVRGNMVCQR